MTDRTINATHGDDYIYGGSGDDEIHLGNGNDRAQSQGGDDVVYGGDGNDWVDTNDGNDIFFGGYGNDRSYGGAGHDRFIGGTGDDAGSGGYGVDSLWGDAGNDHLRGGDGDDKVYGGSGDDSVFGGSGNDLVYGDAMKSAHGDTGAAGHDYMEGGDGHDKMYGGAGNDVMHGGNDNDRLEGGDGDDMLFGGSGNDAIFGQDGDDKVEAGLGDDYVKGGAGNDDLWGSDGNDVMFGESGNDSLDGGAGHDQLDGGDGNDNIKGGSGNDSIIGGHGDDTLDGGSGDDVIGGGSGDDLIHGGDGDDMVEAAHGDDEIYGGAGNDDIWASHDDDYVEGGTGDDSVYGGNGEDTVYGNAGDDTVSGGSGDDTVFGGSGDDILDGDTRYKDDTGVPGDDTLFGGAGNDQINGNEGNDSIQGGSGNDTINGGDGDDVVAGGSNDDKINGGDGNDTLIGDGGDANDINFVVDWDVLGSDGSAAFTEDGETVNVSINTPHNAQGKEWFVENGMLKNWDVTDPSTADLHFDQEVSNVQFTLLDVDSIDKITIMAKDAAGNLVEVQFEDTGVHHVTGNMVTGTQTNGPGPSADNPAQNIGVTIEGPIKHLWIILDDGPDRDYSGTVAVTDITFSLPTDNEDGDDMIDGGDGDDYIDGNGGDDMLTGGAGNDDIFGGDDADTIIGGAGDTVDGGAGGNDHDVLDLTGQGSFYLVGPDGTGNPIPDSNGNGLDGQVIFVDAHGNPTGEIIDFTEIEEILGDEVNRGPDAVADDLDAGEDDTAGVIGNVLGNDTDPDGDDLTVGAVDGDPANVGQPVAGDNGGLVTINEDGTVTFDPNGEFEELGEGEETTTTVTYTVDDGNGGTDTTTVTITVTGENDGPDATDNNYTVGQDEDAGDVDGNAITQDTGNGADSDPESDPLTVSAVNGTAGNVGAVVAGSNGGLFTINADGTIDFDANGEFDELGAGETAQTSVTYTITDGEGGEDTATVNFTINGTNDDPIACPDLYIVTEDETGGDVDGNVITNPSDNNAGLDLDADGDTLTVVGVNGPNSGVGEPIVGDNGGVFVINPDGSFDFSANGEFEGLAPGESAETSVTYTVSDGNGGTSTTTLTIRIDGVNDGPTAVEDDYTADPDAIDDLGNVLGNDTDPEDDALSVAEVNGDPANVGQPIAGDNGGLITIDENGNATFDPNGDFTDLADGEEATTTVEYTITDPDGATSTTTVTVTVTGSNDGPVAVADVYDAGEDDAPADLGNVIGNDTDPDGDPLTVSEVNGDPANVGQPIAGDNGGLVTIDEDGNVSFDPNGDFEALDEREEATTTVTYTVTDPSGAESTTSVTITVTGANDAPTAVMDTDSTDQDTAIVLDNVLGNDTDPEDDPLSVSEVNGDPANVGEPIAGDNGGLITINEDGTASFDPNGDFDDLGEGDSVDTTVTYTIVDDNGETSSTTVTITVTGTNDGPTAVADTGETDEDTPVDLPNVLGNDTDTDGDDLTVGAVNGDPANVGQPVAGDNGGLVTINEDGSASFDPNGEFEGLDDGEEATTTVTYTVTDPDGGESTTTVTVTVTGVNDAPNAVDSAYVVSQDEAAGDVDGNAITDDTGDGADSDPENDPLNVSAVDGEAANVGAPVAGDNGGLFTINADGSIDFDANGEFDELGEGETASTTVTYTIVDDGGLEDTATVTFTVTGTNDGPTAVADDFDAGEDDAPAVVGNVLGNDEDPDNDPLTVSEVNGDPANVGAAIAGDNGGLVTIDEDGNVTFDPNGEFEELGEGEEATTTVEYTVTDPDGQESTTTVTITVTGVNDGPDAIDNAYIATPDEAAGDVDGNVLTDDTGDGVDSDPENDTLTVVGVGAPNSGVGVPVAGSAGGLFIINADGTVDFDANGEFDDLGLNDTRVTTVEYTISDGNGGTDTAVATFTVGGINDGTVSGTDGDDVINPGYVDGDGDIADGNDAILPGDTGNDDLIEGNGGNDTINAGDGNDEVYGGDDDDLINGNQGNDTLYGDDGDDTVNGGLGNDTVFGGEGDDNLNGQDGKDTIFGGTGDDDIDGGAGNDVLDGGEGNDVIEGSEGEDVIDGGTGDDDIWGGLDDDTLTGGEGSDTIGGGDGDDVINAGNHTDPATDYDYPGPGLPGLPIGDNDPDPNDDKDTVFGGAGNDIITTGDDADSIDGGTGDDFIDAGIDDDSITGGEGNDTIIGSQGEDVIEGNDGDDLIYGGLEDEVLDLPDAIDPAPDDNRDTIDGGAGNDTIFGRDDADSLIGGEGDDEIYGGIDDDRIDGSEGNDTLFGDEGDDSLTGNVGDDVLFGGDGNDFVTGGINGGNDEVHGDDGDDTVLGGAGDDTLFGGDGNDTLASDRGDDTLFGGAGDDSIQGGVGDDTIEGGTGDDIIRANGGSDSVDGGDGDDFIVTSVNPYTDTPDATDPDPFDDRDTVEGGAGNDVIRTGDDADTVFGGTGDDVIDSGIDDDFVEGGDGDDEITGGDGEDDLFGGFGSDVFFGGNGGDVVTGGEDPDDGDIDVLDLTGSGVDRIEYVDGDPEAGTVFFLDGTTMTFSEIENVIPCFTPGTTIATPRGERLVEELKEGDKIITRDNGIQEIAWVGHKKMDGKQLAANPHLKPILIKAGSLGHGLPERDMMVSPNHRVLVASELTQLYFEESEVLAAAKHMTGAEGIHAVDVMATTYVHFMFERHEVVLSNGAWTESFQPGDYSLKGIGNGQRNEIFELFPELATKTGLEGYQSARKALKKHEARLLMK